MRSTEEMRSLIKLPLINRLFVISALDRIEVELEKYLMNYEGESYQIREGVDSSQAIHIEMKELFYSAFETEKIDGKVVVVGWNEKVRQSRPDLEVPKAFYHNTWKKIARNALFTTMGISLEGVLVTKGYKVKRSMSDLKNCYIEIAWERNHEENEKETSANSLEEAQTDSMADTKAE